MSQAHLHLQLPSFSPIILTPSSLNYSLSLSLSLPLSMEASIKVDYGQKKMAPKEKVKKEMMVEMMGEADESFDYEDEKVKRPAVSAGGDGGSGKKGSGGGGGATATTAMRCCQAEMCTVDLTDAKQYHRRHKVCEYHAKAQVALVAGFRQRFCQQCSRFHELSEFDDTKRSCRRRLAGHNERRRKTSADSQAAEGSSRKGTGTHLKEFVCGQVDDRGRIQISIQENASYKHFQIR